MNVNGRLTFENLTADPTSPAPAEGDLYYNSTDKGMKLYDGSSWNAVAGGSKVMLDRQVLSGASFVEWTNIATTGYDYYEIYFDVIASGGQLLLQLDNETGNNYQYRYLNSTSVSVNNGYIGFQICAMTNNCNSSGKITMPVVPLVSGQLSVRGNVSPEDKSAIGFVNGVCLKANIDPSNSIKFFHDSAGALTGIFILYGIKNS